MRRPLEKFVAVATDDPSRALDGIYAGAPEAERGAVVAPPHPLYGGSMDSPVVNELCWACAQCGVASLRFNWRGVGGSGGTPSGEPADADADYSAALVHLAETVPGELLACGYSFGALAALRVGAREGRVARIVLVAPPPASLDRETLDAFRGRVLIVAGQHDAIAPAAELTPLVEAHGGARLVVVPEADHFFGAGLAEISRATREWLGAG